MVEVVCNGVDFVVGLVLGLPKECYDSMGDHDLNDALLEKIRSRKIQFVVAVYDSNKLISTLHH